MIPIIFKIGIKLKQISPATNLLVEVTTGQYTNTPQTFKTPPLFKADPLGFKPEKNV